MNRNCISRKMLSIFLALALTVTTMVPATGVVSAAQSSSMEKILSTTISGDIGTPGKNNYVTGMTKDASDNLIVMGTAKSKMGTDDPDDTTQRVFLKKYSKSDLDNPSASAVIIGSGSEDIEQGGYVFGKKEASYYAGDSTYNGALTTDSAGNVYVAVTEKASSEALYEYYWDVSEAFDDCICDGGYTCDEDGCDYGNITECPVCNAYREFNKTFQAGSTKGITVYKFNSNLEQVKSFSIGSYPSTQSGNGDDPWAHGLAVDDGGNIYVGGSVSTDLGFDDPTYGFDDFGGAPGRRGFVAKVNSDMTQVTKSTYLAGYEKPASGGYSGGDAAVNNLAVDGTDLYVIGKDLSGKIPNTDGTFQADKNPASATSADAFVAKLSLADLSVTTATYYGGSGNEEVSGLKVQNGCVYVGGDTTSTDLTVSDNAVNKTRDSGGEFYPDGFVLKLDQSLQKNDKFAASYFNDNGDGRLDMFGLDVDDAGNIYVTGSTTSAYGLKDITTDGSDTGYIVLGKFNQDASALPALSVMGGQSTNVQGRAIIADNTNVYLAGQYDGGSAIQPFVAKYTSTFAHAKVKSIEAVEKGTSSSPRYCGKDAKISIKVTFDAKVTVEGTPALELNLYNGETPQTAEYTDGTGTKVLNFAYTVKAGDTTKGQVLNVSGKDALKINGGSILPAAGGTEEDINLNLPTDSLDRGYIYVETVPAKVASVTSEAEDATYGKGAVIPLTVAFDNNIKAVKGTPELKLNSGGTAIFTGIDSRNKSKLHFEYTVGAGDNAAKLDYKDTKSLTLPEGAAITDNYGAAANLTLPEPGAEGSLAKEKAICISDKAIVVESVSVPEDYQNKAYRSGIKIPITVTFSQGVTTTGNLELQLNAGENYDAVKAVAEPVTDCKDVSFTYTVGKSDTLPSGTYLDYSTVDALVLAKDATITSGDNPVSLYLAKPGSKGSLSQYKVVIDNTAPKNSTAPSLTANSPKAKYYKAGDIVELKVPVNEEVTVKDGANPYIEMDYKTQEDAEQNNQWTYDRMENSGGKSNLYFTYTVKEEDVLKNGQLNDVNNWKIYNSGDIVDAAGNEMDPALAPVSKWVNPLKGIYFDSKAPVWEEGAALKVENVNDQKNVTITRPNASDDGSGLSGSPSPYTLYRQEKGSDKDPKRITTLSSSMTSYTDTTVDPETAYIYTLTAQDNCSNISDPLTAEITTTNSSGEIDDTEAPYWDDDAALTVKRTTESTASVSWDKSRVHDIISGIKEFRIYVKTGLLSGWDLVKTVAGNEESADLTGLSLDETYTFKIEAVDTGNNQLESTTGPQAELDKEFPAMIIKDQNGKNIKQFIDAEVDSWELTESRFSSLNNYGTREYYAATGMDVSQLLKVAGVKNYKYVNLMSGNGDNGRTFTKAQVEGENSWYYGPKYDGINVKAEKVKPMVVFGYGSSEDSEPDFSIGGDGVPRLFFGQTSIDHINKPYFTKEIYYITVNVTEESVSFAENDAYKQDTSQELPAVTAVKEGAASVRAQIDGSKFDSETISVNLVQMRGDKMVAVTSVEKSNNGELEVAADFALKEGDTVKIIVTDKLDGTKGSGAQILNDGVGADTPKITLKDVYLKNTEKAVIKGTAKASQWVSVKLTDQDGQIVYFNGKLADEEGNFSMDADLEGIVRPVGITVTSEKSVASASIYDFHQLKAAGGSKTTQQFTSGKKAAALNSGITGTNVKYQWYSNTTKRNSGGKAIAGAKGKTYVPSTAKAGITYYYAVATDVEGNVLKTPVYTVKVAAKAPAVKAVSKGYKTLGLSWSASAGATSYKLYRATSKSGKYKLVKTTKARSYTDKNRSFNKRYYYKVTAVSSGGNGTSKIVSAKPVPAKTGITKISKKSSTSRLVKWKKVAGATGYQISYSRSKTFKKGTVKSKTVKGTSKTISSLKKGKKYYVKVRAYRTYKGKKIYGPYSAVKSK